jgi:hypothetical protein
MKHLNTKTLLAASVAALISVNSTAEEVNKQLTVTFVHPQSVAIDDATATSTATAQADSGGTGTATTWKVTSNNAVKVKFTGTSFTEGGTGMDTPILAKQEVNASNIYITGAYDQLLTEYGVVITNSSSTENSTTTWGGGATPKGASGTDAAAYGVGTPTNLVSVDSINGPTRTFGAIMGQDDGTFSYTLYTKGTGDQSSTQSGSYTAIITTTITAEEKTGN